MQQYCELVQRSKSAELAKFALLCTARWLPVEMNLAIKA
jgi:hypothetical protein